MTSDLGIKQTFLKGLCRSIMSNSVLDCYFNLTTKEGLKAKLPFDTEIKNWNKMLSGIFPSML